MAYNPYFRFFDIVNSGDFSAIDKMTDEEIKEFSPFVLTMWANGAIQNTGIHVILTDLYCNQYVFPLYKHQRLLLKLVIAANSDIDQSRYRFAKYGNKSQDGKIESIAKYYGCSTREAKQYAELLSEDEIKIIKEIVDE